MPTPQQFDEARRHAGACIDFVGDACHWLWANGMHAIEDPESIDLPDGAWLTWNPSKAREHAAHHLARLDLAVDVARRSVDAVVVALRAAKPDAAEPVEIWYRRWVTAHEAVVAMTDELRQDLATQLSWMEHSDSETARLVKRLSETWVGMALGDLRPTLDREHAVARTRAEASQAPSAQLAEPPQAEADAGGGKVTAETKQPKPAEWRAYESYQWVCRERPDLVPDPPVRFTPAMLEHIRTCDCPAYLDEDHPPPMNFETWKRQVRAGEKATDPTPKTSPRADRDHGSSIVRHDQI